MSYCDHVTVGHGKAASGVPRVRCLACGKTWTTYRTKSKVSQEREDKVLLMLHDGYSICAIARAGVANKRTVMRLAKRNGIAVSRGVKDRRRDNPHRRRYLSAYHAGNKHGQNIKRNVKIREFLCELLAKSIRPMLFDDVFRESVSVFPHLKRCSLGYILSRNIDENFVSLGRYWTYEPSFFHVDDPDDSAHGKARKAWFEKFGLKDNIREAYQQGKKKAVEQEEVLERYYASLRAAKTLQMFAVAQTISNTLTKIHERS